MLTSRRQMGFSEAAETIYHWQIVEDDRKSETVTFSNYALDDQLVDVFWDSRDESENDQDSEPVDGDAILIAKDFVSSLPRDLQSPEINGEPDGHVSLEWYVNPRRLINVSVAPDGILHWAALIGEEDPRGTCPFRGEAPKSLVYHISRVLNG